MRHSGFMRIVVIFFVLLMVSIAGISILASTTFQGGTAALAEIANVARTVAETPADEPAPSAGQATAAAPAEGEAVTFVIRQGETTGSIAQRLADMKLVPNATLFRYWVQWRGAESRLQAGEYQLRHGMSMDELVDVLQTAKAADVAITFVEGQRLEEFAEAIQKANVGIDGERFLELARRGNFAYDFLEGKPAGASLEGYLFPDTYRVIPNKTTAEELIHQMLARFGQAFSPQLREEARRNTGLTLHQTVILASIVEREAQRKEERPRIAAVFTNRLRVNECLCADATIQYWIGRSPDWWPRLRDQVRNIAPESPYNTYTNHGLPPGPIASPGLSALQAAARPEQTDYMYYVRDDIKNDGSHQFARTLDEHQRNIARYQRSS